MTVTVDLSYPVGRFEHNGTRTADTRRAAIDDIEALPARMRESVRDLTDAQLDTPYRPGGWTVRQLVHHVADSHMNGYIRTKLAVTEQNPTIKPYDQDAWSKLPDSRLPIHGSLAILDAVHARWTAINRSLRWSRYSVPSSIKARIVGVMRTSSRTITTRPFPVCAAANPLVGLDRRAHWQRDSRRREDRPTGTEDA